MPGVAQWQLAVNSHKRMNICIAQSHKATKLRNIDSILNFFMASWLCAREIGQVKVEI
jgi:hypothetical protein